MQGTIATYDGATRTGSVFLDDGARVPFGADAAVHARFLRPGQRVFLERTTDGSVSSLRLF